MKEGYHWTDEQDEIVMRADLTLREIGALVGRTWRAAKSRRERLLHGNEKKSSGRANAGIHIGQLRPDPSALADRDRRLSLKPTITGAILGDPLPGYSALDRLQAVGRSTG